MPQYGGGPYAGQPIPPLYPPQYPPPHQTHNNGGNQINGGMHGNHEPPGHRPYIAPPVVAQSGYGYMDPRAMSMNQPLQYPPYHPPPIYPQQYYQPPPQPSIPIPRTPVPVTHLQRVQETPTAARIVLPNPGPSRDRSSNVQVAQVVQKSAPQPVPKPAPKTAPFDKSIVLLALAEDYFSAAYALSAQLSADEVREDMTQYHELMAFGLACLETALTKCALSPATEAATRLRYATILHEETENKMEAEEALSKGITLADRHKIFDMKYSMQHLMVRILFSSNPRAAFKLLESIISDAAAFQHFAWVYALRFLSVTLHLQLGSRQDLSTALSDLSTIAGIARQYGESAILAMASAMEALVWLKGIQNAETFEHIQRALATVRSLQLNPAIGKMSHLTLLVSFVDLGCHLAHYDNVQAAEKRQIMQHALDPITQGDTLAESQFDIPLVNVHSQLGKLDEGMIRRQADGTVVFSLSWACKDDLCNVGYFLSGLTLAHRNPVDGQKAEQMFAAGLKRQLVAQKQSGKTVKSLIQAQDEKVLRQRLSCYMNLNIALLSSVRSRWDKANRHLDAAVELMDSGTRYTTTSSKNLALYVRGTIDQGTGDLAHAYMMYNYLMPSFDTNNDPTNTHSPKDSSQPDDATLLGALNAALMTTIPSSRYQESSSDLMAFLARHCPNHPNRIIQAAYHLAAASQPGTTIITTKASLTSALNIAKAQDIIQLLCIVLNIMSWRFFRGVVGNQAEKSAQASQSLASRVGAVLWMAVSAGIMAGTLETAGRAKEAQAELDKGWAIVDADVPDMIKKTLGLIEDVKDTDDAMTDLPR